MVNTIPGFNISRTRKLFSLLFIAGILRLAMAGEPAVFIPEEDNPDPDYTPSLGRVGDFTPPTNPSNDRAMGMAIKGKARSTILNYGDFIDIDVDRDGNWDDYPAGLWGNYAYLPQVGFMAGIPGNYPIFKFGDWQILHSYPEFTEWISLSAGAAWMEDQEVLDPLEEDFNPNFVGVVFETYNDRGVTPDEAIYNVDQNEIEFTGPNQWYMDRDNAILHITLLDGVDPRNANAYGNPTQRKGIGMVYPWAMRPKYLGRPSGQDFDEVDYSGCDDYGASWYICDKNALEYYGSNVSESWYKRRFNTDWQPSTKARIYTHNTIVGAGDIFGDTPYVADDDEYPLLAHSNYGLTWPTLFDEETGLEEPFWPGWWAEEYNTDLPGCTGTRRDPRCWREVPGRFISDSDIYMEFDDRWAHNGNNVDGQNYESSGYPMGLRVMATAHSYGISYAEDIMFVTVKVRNESGDFCAFKRDQFGNEIDVLDENGQQVCGEGVVLPDGTKINGGKGFDYRRMSLGFYFDADSYSQTESGSTAGRTNDDDTMEYYDSTHVVNNEDLIISMAMIYDFDGISGQATDLGIVGVQLLDSPFATDTLYRHIHGIDRLPGQKLKMTDWHWFHWYNRPGVRNPGISPPTAENKEEIQYKIMTGDTTNISAAEKQWHFHTDQPETDPDYRLNPHFDSLDGLELEDDFVGDPLGVDAVLIMSCGPFDLDVGEEVPFSFTIIFGEDQFDIIRNAEFAQIMYNSHYQGFTAPTIPNVFATVGHQQVTLTWDNVAEYSRDVITGYADFEGYRIYKSIDGGRTWGTPYDIIRDINGISVGWESLAQYDLTLEEDMNLCIHSFNDCSANPDSTRGIEISGPDPLAPWFDLGSNTGLQHSFVDEDVIDGMEYTYSVTAYDMGVEADYEIDWTEEEQEIDIDIDGDGSTDTTITYASWIPDTTWSSSNPDHWASPFGYASLETPRGTTVHDPNFVTVIPGYRASNITFPDPESIEEFIHTNPGVVGNGDKFYSVVNEETLSDALVRMEIQAERWTNSFEGYAVENPSLYIYEIDSETEQNPVEFWTVNTNEISEDSLAYLMDLPGSDMQDDTTAIVPYYKLDDYKLAFMDDTDFENNWSQFFDGIRIRFDNGPESYNSLEETDQGKEMVLKEIEYHPDSSLLNLVHVRLIAKNQDLYAQRPPYEYRIEFSSTVADTADRMTPSSACNDDPWETSQLPFSVINQTTGRRVGIQHVDKGYNNGSSDPGYKDCQWQRNEQLGLRYDSVTTANDTIPSDEYIFDMYIDFPYMEYDFSTSDWNALIDYESETAVRFANMYYYNIADVVREWTIPAPGDTIKPNTWFDNNEDGLNDNLWRVWYPWMDGDYMVIKPARWYVDGDSWTADLSILGRPHKVTQAELEEVRVVPNPYVVRSLFNETEYIKRMRFTHLPQNCKITIFTISGEIVRELEHHDPYEGNLWWDLRSKNNQEVAPGLYIYVVEAGGKQHIGKFAIVR